MTEADFDPEASAEDEEEEEEDEEEGGYSHKRMCLGLCGALPAILWSCVLIWLLTKSNTRDCSHTAAGEGDIMRFLQMSAAGFITLVVIEVVEGCMAGEQDFKTSPTEICINVCTVLVFIAIYCINYYGVIQLYTAKDCHEGLLTTGWIALVGNNVMWFLTVATMIAMNVCGAGVAACDFMSGDRL
mmetsp:Transcript_4230/g.9690  ORF Transcript_4230/g.9690 Transcript_4230/m.9690 type:complete len:186 (+) Transcript_4230:100-657(+)|eukprot:CAMPEP_0197888406 /NCGR_PEP_ID=MMETSP1439-20131203/21971_1 /TAXON_ID=66791 /ORGANISM="Gonyaulax spinifera, Strain CCMP409" /LENGTH=185 /DNA_ID=CAMNT_0043508315 /DNA_START=100 /DNA_END=657 /DNA_ORIENTATION=-